MGPIVKKWMIAVRVPVFDSKGKVIYALSGTVTAQQLNTFLGKQAIQDNQIITVVDPVGRIAARSKDSPDLIGMLVRPEYLQHLIDAPSGQFEGVNLKDVPVSLTYYQSPVSKYTVSVATPLSNIKQDQWRTLKPFLWLALIVLVLGLIIGIRVSAEIARSVAQLIPLARDLGLGKSVEPLSGPISEVNEVSTALSEASAQLNYAQHQASHDVLTGLANRAMISHVTEQQIALSSRKHHSFALLFLDIDKFKNINDTYGHDMGDLLLVEVAARMKHVVRAYDTVGRLGGDEFVILLPNTNLEMAHRTADQILKVISEHAFNLNNIKVHISCSIGIALYPANAENRSALFKLADTALYEAKGQGRNRAVAAKDL
jgi:diguanylate cyclase (GGDEF)-like protein